MDEKTFACLSRGMMILWEAYWERHGVVDARNNSRIVLADDPDRSLVWPPERAEEDYQNSWQTKSSA